MQESENRGLRISTTFGIVASADGQPMAFQPQPQCSPPATQA
jgi:hypothetical protein